MGWNDGDGNNPWGNRPNGNNNPWGNRSGGGNGPGTPPDLDEILRKTQEQLKSFIPGGGGSGGSSPKAFIVLALLAGLFLIGLQGLAQGHFLGFYRINDGEVGVVQRFGAYTRQAEPGLHWLIPMVEKYTAVSLSRINRIELGTSAGSNNVSGLRADSRLNGNEDMMMLTGDANIVDLQFTVQWRVSDPVQFLFNMRDPENTLRMASASVMREIMGQSEIMSAIGSGRENIRIDMEKRLRDLMASYKSGIFVDGIQLQRMEAPAPVLDAFIKAQSAQQEATRLSNVAEGYRSSILPAARAEANRLIEEARAYKAATVADAQGDAARFSKVYEAYKGSESTTSTRLYLETMEQVLGPANKIILSNEEGGKVMPYLPLNNLAPRAPATSGSAASTAQ